MSSKTNNFLGFVALISVFGTTGLVFGVINVQPTLAKVETQQAGVITSVEPANYKKGYDFNGVTIKAKAAYVLDIANKKSIFKKNPETQLPLASITKVAVVLLADKYLSMNGIITISAKAISTEGDSGFGVGERWKTRDLIDFTLMTSSNDGIVAIAQAIEEVTGKNIETLLNNQAKRLKLSQTYFTNETGLDSSASVSGTYGSVKDMATLFAYAYKTAPEIFAATSYENHTFTDLNGKIFKAKNTNLAIGKLPGLVFGKTGFTDLAGGNLVVVTEPEPLHPFVIVVLGSTWKDRFSDVVSLENVILGNKL